MRIILGILLSILFCFETTASFAGKKKKKRISLGGSTYHFITSPAGSQYPVLVLTPSSRRGRGADIRGTRMHQPIFPSMDSSANSAHQDENVIYAMTPNILEGVPILDLQGQMTDLALLPSLLAPAQAAISTDHHRYVGRAGCAEKRAAGHAQCVRKNPERRLPKQLIRYGRSDRRLYMQLLITGIHPDQIEDIETMLIEMFDGTGDLGLNSQTGRKNKILKNLDVDSEQEDDVDDEDVDEEKENEGVDDLFHKRKKGPKEDDDKGGSNFGSSCIGFSSAIAVSS